MTKEHALFEPEVSRPANENYRIHAPVVLVEPYRGRFLPVNGNAKDFAWFAGRHDGLLDQEHLARCRKMGYIVEVL